MMEFKIIVKKWAVFYFFIQNLSEWHFSCREDYNILWRKELGPFTEKQEKALKQFKKLHQKYSFGKHYLGRHFYLRKNPWKSLEKELSKQEFNNIKDIFSLFKEKFEIFYKKELPLLKKWKYRLEKWLGSKKKKLLLDKINFKLSRLYNSPLLKKRIRIYLLFSSPDRSGGSASLDGKSISLEISRCPLEKLNKSTGIILHELIHLHFEKHSFKHTVEKIVGKSKKSAMIVLETTASALFPAGYLGQKFLNIENEKRSLHILFVKEKLYDRIMNLIKKYVTKDRRLDEEYLEEIISIIK